MTLKNKQIVRSVSFGALLCLTLAACASGQIKSAEDIQDAPLSQQADPACGSECKDEDGTSRYQYYLGILSVFILG